MKLPFHTLHIMPGLLCNLRCAHCANSSGPEKRQKITSNEISVICKEIEKYAPRKIIFTGGEPTLHIEVINEIIDAVPELDQTEIQLTSNGWYLTSRSKTRDVLDQIKKLDSLQLSFDVFHGSKLDSMSISHFADYCIERNIIQAGVHGLNVRSQKFFIKMGFVPTCAFISTQRLF